MQQVRDTISFDDKVIEISSPLALDIPDEELEEIVKERIETSEKFFNTKYNLAERRKKNETYLFGRQIAELEEKGKLKDYETRSAINAIYEIEASIKPLAMSKLPDIIVTPGTDQDDKKSESAKNLSKVVDTTNKKREQREVLGLAFKHLPVYFTSIIKAVWNQQKGKDGDYEFIVVNPNNIVADHTATGRNVDNMSFIAQCVPMSAQEIIMKFPSKKAQIIEKLQKKGIEVGGDPSWKDLSSELKLWEVWFDWYKRKDKKELLTKDEMLSIYEPGIVWESVSGVLWRLDDLILDKMLDPNYDHVGERRLFSYAVPGDESTKVEVTPDEMYFSAMSGSPVPNMSAETIYHNYFDRPHKPFYFMGYDQWGKVYIDETSRIEQNLRNQENLDDLNKETMDQLKTRVKHIWSKDSGLTKAQIQRLDLDDPKMDAMVEGNPNLVHAEVKPERPDAAQFNALGSAKQEMYAVAGATAVRGQLQSDVATTNQIAREADFTRADDLVEDTINSAAEWIAEWQLQFIKLRYTNEHMKQIMGAKGEVTYLRIKRDSISDGMEVMVKASSTDKLKAQRNAMETAKLGPPFSNPVDFFQDMGMNDAEGRTERGLMFMSDPNTYYTKYVLGIETPPPGAVPPGPGNVPPPAGMPPQGAPTGAPPAGPTSTDTTQAAATPPSGPPQASPRAM